MTAAEQSRTPQKSGDIIRQYPQMLELAAQMNCNLQPSRDDRTILRGLCPFHQASRIHDSRTLRIDAKTGRFRCDYCSKAGTPLAFAAITWGVNAKDAHILLEHYNGSPITPDRPPFPADHRQPAQGEERYPWINSALLSRAADYYHELVYSNYPPLRTLAKLGVSPEKAEKAGVGYCAGDGLKEYLLEQTDITEDELAGSTLWEDNGAEALAGRITITDRDHTGGAIWITSIVPERDEQGRDWRNEVPYNRGIRGAKPFLFGQYSVTAQSEWACITDDARLYIAAASAAIPSILLTQIRRGKTDDDIAQQCRRIAAGIQKRRPRSVTLCLHDRQAAAIIGSMLQQPPEPVPALIHHRDSFLKQLKPETRNLDALRQEPPPNPRQARRKREQEEKAAQEARTEAVKPEPATGEENGPPPQQDGTDQPAPEEQAAPET